MHKLRRAMVRPGRERLAGVVEVDETYWGAEEEGVSGRQTERKALIAVAAEERGRGLGRIRMQRVRNASAASLMPFVEESVEPGSVVHTDGWLGYEPLEKKATSIASSFCRAAASRPRNYCRGCTKRSRCSSAGCWARTKARLATSIWTTTSTSLCSASTGATHAAGENSSTALCSRQSPWTQRRIDRSSPTGTLRPREPNHKMLGLPESSGYPILANLAGGSQPICAIIDACLIVVLLGAAGLLPPLFPSISGTHTKGEMLASRLRPGRLRLRLSLLAWATRSTIRPLRPLLELICRAHPRFSSGGPRVCRAYP